MSSRQQLRLNCVDAIVPPLLVRIKCVSKQMGAMREIVKLFREGDSGDWHNKDHSWKRKQENNHETRKKRNHQEITVQTTVHHNEEEREQHTTT